MNQPDTAVQTEIADYAALSQLFTRSAPSPAEMQLDCRFYRVLEITEGTAAQHRLAMANVISTLNINQAADSSPKSLVYLLSGRPGGIRLYIGVAARCKRHRHHAEKRL